MTQVLRRRPLLVAAALLTAALAAGTIRAMCTPPSVGPDVIVADLYGWGNNWQNDSGCAAADPTKRAYSLATKSLNIGDKDLHWENNCASNPGHCNEHPVIAQNLYRLKTDNDRPGGRLEQIGMSWLKHGFTALANNEYCSGGAGTGCTFEAGHSSGKWLGQGCSDPYSASLNASQSNLGPRSQVNPSTGVYPYPFTAGAPVDDCYDRRMIVADADVDSTLNAGARWFAEGQYVASDDAAAGNGFNNASFRESVLTNTTSRTFGFGGTYGSTQQQLPAIAVWPLIDPSVDFAYLDIVADGRFHVAAKVHDYGNGVWRYEYAIHNLNSNRSAQRLEIPVPAGTALTNVGFHDVDPHSGEPYSTADWTIDADGPNGHVAWFGETFALNQNANALRWGTMYNFWFDADQPPGAGTAAITLFRPPGAGEPTTVSVNVPVPGGTGLFRDDWESGTGSAWDAVAP